MADDHSRAGVSFDTLRAAFCTRDPLIQRISHNLHKLIDEIRHPFIKGQLFWHQRNNPKAL